ncbi:MAG: hypothetical protein AMXMBFR7_13260 [Planctomycetota bacterium]
MRSPILEVIAVCLLTAMGVRAGENAPPLDDKAQVQAFWQTISKADKPELKADAVYMLRGLKSKEAYAALTGLLGFTDPGVRRNACRVIAETDDPSGYFVKPLMGPLYDQVLEVRQEAAAALSKSKLRGPAIRALTTALTREAEKPKPELAWAYRLHKALSELSGHEFKDAENAADLAQQWQAWWNEHRSDLEAEEAAKAAP